MSGKICWYSTAEIEKATESEIEMPWGKPTTPQVNVEEKVDKKGHYSATREYNHLRGFSPPEYSIRIYSYIISGANKLQR